MRRQRGFTLLELLVSILLLGIVSSVSALALRGVDHAALPSLATIIRDSASRSARERRDIAITVRAGDSVLHAWILATGRIVADSPFVAEPLASRSANAR